MSISTAKKIKQSGYRKGIPDLIFYEPRFGYMGLCMEIKKKGGRVSPHQHEWRADLLKRGYQAVVCTGLHECVQQFNTYFRLNLPLPRLDVG